MTCQIVLLRLLFLSGLTCLYLIYHCMPFGLLSLASAWLSHQEWHSLSLGCYYLLRGDTVLSFFSNWLATSQCDFLLLLRISNVSFYRWCLLTILKTSMKKISLKRWYVRNIQIDRLCLNLPLILPNSSIYRFCHIPDFLIATGIWGLPPAFNAQSLEKYRHRLNKLGYWHGKC